MTNTHKMISRLFEQWELDDTQKSTLLAMIDDDGSTAMLLLQIHAMLRLLYPDPPLRYEWVMLGNRELSGARPIDLMLAGSEGIRKIDKTLRMQLQR